MTSVIFVTVRAIVVFAARAFVRVFGQCRASAIVVTRITGDRYRHGENDYCDIQIHRVRVI